MMIWKEEVCNRRMKETKETNEKGDSDTEDCYDFDYFLQSPSFGILENLAEVADRTP
jgi:hypothetical protein